MFLLILFSKQALLLRSTQEYQNKSRHSSSIKLAIFLTFFVLSVSDLKNFRCLLGSFLYLSWLVMNVQIRSTCQCQDLILILCCWNHNTTPSVGCTYYRTYYSVSKKKNHTLDLNLDTSRHMCPDSNLGFDFFLWRGREYIRRTRFDPWFYVRI